MSAHHPRLGRMELRPIRDGEHERVRTLLVEAQLPVEDLTTAQVELILAIENGEPVGVVGLEAFGKAGLLRSLAVDAEHRGTGTGMALVDAIESHARTRGIRQLVLLTQTAEPFFARRDYQVVPRDGVPDAVRQSAEFRSICPASATCMSKQLQARAPGTPDSPRTQ